jgi:hypothetical protein
MRSEYLLLSLLAPIDSFARRGRDPDYKPSPPLVSEEEVEEAIQSFDMSPRERQAVFGDTGKLDSTHLHGYKLRSVAIIKRRLQVTDCHSSIANQLEGRCKSEKDQREPNEAYRSDRKFARRKVEEGKEMNR